MPTRVIVNGANGKMGALACETIKKHPDFELVASLSRGNDLRAAIRENQAQIVVDFTRADSVYENSLAIIQTDAHPIIGTSGLTAGQIEKLSALSEQKKLGGIIVPNFSISAMLMMRFAAEAARLLTDVEIVEAHHHQKFDAPSGTAIKTAEMLAKAKMQNKNSIPIKNQEVTGARGESFHGIPIHSLRLPGVLAYQQVIFGSLGETLSITHNSIDRASFMPGVILACQHVQNLHSLHYGLDFLLDK